MATAQMALPSSVCFKGDNNKYLSAQSINGNNYLTFSSLDIGDPRVRHTIVTNKDGTIRIKSDYFGKFWRLGSNSWILADYNGPSIDDPYILFKVIKVDNCSFALKNLGNNKFCKRLTNDQSESGLNAFVESIDQTAHLCLHEPVISRRIYNVQYQTLGVEPHDVEKILSINKTEAVNHGTTPNKAKVVLTYSLSSTKTWESKISMKLAVTTTIEAGIPKVVNATVQVQHEISADYTWGRSITSADEKSVEYEVTIPPKTKVILCVQAKEATFEVPFSYSQ